MKIKVDFLIGILCTVSNIYLEDKEAMNPSLAEVIQYFEEIEKKDKDYTLNFVDGNEKEEK